MPIDLRVAEAVLTERLAEIGIAATLVTVRPVDSGTNAYVVRIVSDAFDGQTFLDRELRARPAISKAFAVLQAARADFVVEPLTADESDDEEARNSAVSRRETDDTGAHEIAVGKSAWRKERISILDALRSSHYSLTEFSDNIVIAERQQLAQERIVLGFAVSPNASTVDLETRREIQTIRDSQRVSACYYLSAHHLERPFSNQSGARWLNVHTPSSFLHLLNQSVDLAKRLIEDIDKEALRLSPEHRGHVIEPDIRRRDQVIVQTGFFDYVTAWVARDEASLLVVMAPAGHGKTTLSLELARRFASGFIQQPDVRPIPLVVPFEAVRRVVDFESLMHKRLAELRPGALGAFSALMYRKDAVLIVDGFDELADDAGFEAAEAQIRSMKFLLQGKAKVLLAGRSLFTEGFAGRQSIDERMRSLLGDIAVDVVEILPFDKANTREFVNTRDGLSNEQRAEVLAFCDASPDHEQLASNPLFLRILCSLAADEKLPDAHALATGVDVLLEQVCVREEVRQHLGIGVVGQQEFLQWLASEIHANGKGVLQAELETWAELIVSQWNPSGGGELAGRLSDHALLRRTKDGRVEFIHPFIRDVVIGQHVRDALRRGSAAPLGTRDMPEGAILYLAARMSDFEAGLKQGWLAAGGQDYSTTARRNLFRVATRSARFKDEGNPREWVRREWVRGALRGLDLSNLPIESLSFDSLSFESCDFSGTLFDDCDFRATRFTNCTFVGSVFDTCRSSDRFRVESSEVSNVLVKVRERALAVDGNDHLRAAILGADFGTGYSEGPPADAVARTEELTKRLLLQLVTLDPSPHFHQITDEAIENVGETGREREAVERVLLPGVIRKVCSATLAAGSRRKVAIDKRFHGAAAAFLLTGAKSQSLTDIFSTLAARAARYLT